VNAAFMGTGGATVDRTVQSCRDRDLGGRGGELGEAAGGGGDVPRDFGPEVVTTRGLPGGGNCHSGG
jgi:hypothetical protein